MRPAPTPARSPPPSASRATPTGLERLYGEIDALDGAVPGALQLGLYAEIGTLLERETLWLLRNADFTQPLGDLSLHYAAGRD